MIEGIRFSPDSETDMRSTTFRSSCRTWILSLSCAVLAFATAWAATPIPHLSAPLQSLVRGGSVRVQYQGRIMTAADYLGRLKAPTLPEARSAVSRVRVAPTSACGRVGGRITDVLAPVVDGCGNVLVDVFTHRGVNLDPASLTALGAIDVLPSPVLPEIRAWVPIAKLAQVASLPGVVMVRTPILPLPMGRPRPGPVTAGYPIQSGGSEEPIQALVMQTLPLVQAGITGNNVNVGLISDGDEYLPYYQSQGFLPANATNVGSQTSSASGDEGSWMMQIVYQDAPSANLAFCSGFAYSIPTCASDLITRFGANVVSDDLGTVPIFYFPLPDALGYNQLMTEYPNVLFFTSAGNWGNDIVPTNGLLPDDGYYQANYTPTTLTLIPDNSTTSTTYHVQDFGASLGQSSSALNEFELPPGYGVALYLGWTDNPTINASTGDCPTTNNVIGLDLVEIPTNSSGEPTGATPIELANSGPSSTEEGYCPFGVVEYANNGSNTLLLSPVIHFETMTSTTNLNFKLLASIVSNSGSGSFPLTYFTDGSAGADRSYPGAQPMLLEAGAVEPFGGPAGVYPVEPFSSGGPYTFSWNCNAAETSCTPVSYQAEVPNIAAPDEDIVNMEGTMTGFYGTSAASPGAASVATLLLSAGAKPTAIPQALEETAVPQTSTSGWDPNYGYGVVDALAAAGDVLPPVAHITDPSTNESVTVGSSVFFGGYCTTAIPSALDTELNASWNFGSGLTGSGIVPKPVVYTRPGVYTVTMTCATPSGIVSKPATTSVTVVPGSGGGGSLGLLSLFLLATGAALTLIRRRPRHESESP
jgi:hypothetical protein